MSWSKSSLDIAEVMLTRPGARLTVPDLAVASGWSKPQVSLVLQEFDRLEWTSRHRPGRGPNVFREALGGRATEGAGHLRESLIRFCKA